MALCLGDTQNQRHSQNWVHFVWAAVRVDDCVVKPPGPVAKSGLTPSENGLPYPFSFVVPADGSRVSPSRHILPSSSSWFKHSRDQNSKPKPAMSCASRWGTIETQDRIVAPAASRGSSVGDGPAIAWLE